MTYQEENDILLNKTYEEYFYNNWKKENEDSKSLELIFSPYCNLKCRYCYLHKHYDKQFPIETFNAKKSIDNALKICQWLVNNHYTPELDIFQANYLPKKADLSSLKKYQIFILLFQKKTE